MAYLNVIPPPSIPIPSLRGLGGPVLVRPRGMGQVATTCAQYLAQQLAALPPASTAAMLLNTPTPSGAVLSSLYINGATSPDQAAQVVYQLAQEFCGQQADNVTFGGTLPGDCSDSGTAAANAAYPAWLAYYQALPASVWTTGTVSAQVANPQLFFSPTPAAAPPAQPAQSPLGPQIIQQSAGQNPLPPAQQDSVYSPPPPPPAPVQTPAQTSPAQPAQPPTLALPSWLTNDISLGGYDVPVWGLIAAGAAVLFFLPKGHR